jgi:hypothetical protein
MKVKHQRPEQQGRAQEEGKGSQAGRLGQAVARAVGQSLAVGGVALSSFMGLGLGLGLGMEGAGAAGGGGWSYDKQTVQKQVARVDKAEQKELRDEVKDPASVIAKVRYVRSYMCVGLSLAGGECSLQYCRPYGMRVLRLGMAAGGMLSFVRSILGLTRTN